MGLFGRSHRRVAFEDIEAVDVITREGSEGTDYAVEIRLHAGDREEVGSGGFISRQKARDVATAIEERL